MEYITFEIARAQAYYRRAVHNRSHFSPFAEVSITDLFSDITPG